jgi:hypothetical protein
MSSEVLSLPPAIERLYAVVVEGKPVKVVEMYRAVYSDPAPKSMSAREMQQHIGWAVTNLNRRIRKQRKILKPAEIKGTYALVKL